MAVDQMLIAKLVANDILHPLLDSCTPAAMVKFAKTCTQAKLCVNRYEKSAFNINTALERYFNDPVAFRNLQGTTAAIISGSFAVQFLARTVFPDADFDLFVPSGAQEAWADFTVADGYHYMPGKRQASNLATAIHSSIYKADDNDEEDGRDEEDSGDEDEAFFYYCKAISHVFTFVKGTGPSFRKVQIIVTDTVPMEAILRFHSTCVMNIITAERAVALYPRETFVHKQSLVTQHGHDPALIRALHKYTQRGFNVIRDWRGHPVYSSRSIDDAHTWTIQFDTTGIRPPLPKYRDPVLSTSWKLRLYPSGEAMMSFDVICLNEVIFPIVNGREELLELAAHMLDETPLQVTGLRRIARMYVKGTNSTAMKASAQGFLRAFSFYKKLKKRN